MTQQTPDLDAYQRARDAYQRARDAQTPVQTLIYRGRYTEAMGIIRERFCGVDQTAVPERFLFDLDTWLSQVIGDVRESSGRAAFIRDLMALESNVENRMAAVCRVANTRGVQPDVFLDLVAILSADLNREAALYASPGLGVSGDDYMSGPLWLVLLLCVCRPTKGGSFGTLAHKRVFTEQDLQWIDQAAAIAVKHGADLGLCKTVTWMRVKPTQQNLVANIEARYLRKGVEAEPVEDGEPVKARARVRL